MSKVKTALAIREHASLAAKAFERLEADAAKVLKESEGAAHSFQMVADASAVSGLIKAPGVTVRFQDGTFAVDLNTVETVEE
jgi:hypothetical protein